jgi:hypothetical protein
MEKLPKDILIKLLTTIQDPKEMNDTELDTNINKYIHEKLNRNLVQVQKKIENIEKFRTYGIKFTKMSVIYKESQYVFCLYISSDFFVSFTYITKSMFVICVCIFEGNKRNILHHFIHNHHQNHTNLPVDENYQNYCDFVIDLHKEGYLSELIKII